MATNRALRTALLKKLGISKQTLSARVQKKISELPMSTTEATYVIAHDVGVKIHQYLSGDEVEKVRMLQAQLRHAGASPSHARAPAVNGAGRRSAVSGPREIRFSNKIKVSSTMLSATKLSEAREMAALYPILYVLENSMREVVKRVMRAAFGDDWWETQLVAGKLKNVHGTAASRMKTESSQRWHQRRGSHPIDYIGIDDLGDIVLGKQSTFFPNVLATDADWFRHFMKELEPSRNVLCHMNPLSPTNARDLMTKLERWEALVKAAGPAIPAS
jgi:Swt1-like HEPN